jgi:hypothetical protein
MQMAVDRDAQLVLEREADFRCQVAALIMQKESERTHRQHQAEPRPERPAFAQHGIVENDLLNQRQEAHQDLAHHRHAGTDQQCAPLPSKVGTESRPPSRRGRSFS